MKNDGDGHGGENAGDIFWVWLLEPGKLDIALVDVDGFFSIEHRDFP